MEKISVSIRVRPLDKQEAAKGTPWKINKNAITLCASTGTSPPVYLFDNVFGMDSTTLAVYSATTRDIVASAVKGINGTILAYGQTSSGKTFTMRGAQDEPGIIPLAVHDVFKNLEEAVDREFLLRMSYMEIYNEDINDLLAPDQTKLQVHESLERGIFVAGLRQEIVTSPEQVLQLMEFGEAHRHVGETNMNVHSSRSHTIFRMVIESRDKSQDDSLEFSCRVSVLNLVDLAGSERIAKTGAEGTRLKEGTHINKSLMVLGTVINKLSEGVQNQGGHIPYRDSKLTRILQPALGGNARTAVICNITPAVVHVDESRGTLQFASRAMRVTNCAQVNEILTDAALLKRQKKEIEELRCKLKASHSEHFEEEILRLRNTLLQSECAREKIALELEEQKRAYAERERKQAQKIENLSTMVLNSTVDDRNFGKRARKTVRRETWCPRITSGNQPDEIMKKSFTEERWTLQNRDRMPPLPPPFESLLEDDFNLSAEINGEIDVNAKPVAVPDISARIYVADRKRKYSPFVINEDSVYEQEDFFERQEQDDLQNSDGMECDLPLISQMKEDASVDSMNLIDPVQNRGFNEMHDLQSSEQVENTDKLSDSKNAKCFDSELNDSAKETIQKLEEIRHKDQFELGISELEKLKALNRQLKTSLVEAEESLKVQREELNDRTHMLDVLQAEVFSLKEANQAISQELIDCKANNAILENNLNDLKVAHQEILGQLTDVHLQYEVDRATWAVSNGNPFTSVPTVTESSKTLNLEKKVLELENELAAANSALKEELEQRMKKSEEVITLSAEITALERMIHSLRENNLRKNDLSSNECCCNISTDIGVEKSHLQGRKSELRKGRDQILEAENVVKEKACMDSVSVILGESCDLLDVTVEDCIDNKEDINVLKTKHHDLQTFVEKIVKERDEYILELDLCKRKIKEHQKEAADSKIAAKHEQCQRLTEVKNLEEKLTELETLLFQERALREKEVKQVNELRRNLSFLEDSVNRDTARFSKEKQDLKTQILKLEVSLDAAVAKREVFEGRWLEGQDELKDMHMELDHLKTLYHKLNEENKREVATVSVSAVEGNETIKPLIWMIDDHTMVLSSDKDAIPDQALQNTVNDAAEVSQKRGGKLNRESNMTVQLNRTAKDKLNSRPSHTVCLPPTSQRGECKGSVTELMGQCARPLLSARNGNIASSNIHNNNWGNNLYSMANMKPIHGQNNRRRFSNSNKENRL